MTSNVLTSPIEKQNSSTDSTSFSVQFAALKNKLPKAQLQRISKIGKVKTIEQNGFLKYQIVDINSLSLAKSIKKKLANAGYGGSFILSKKHS